MLWADVQHRSKSADPTGRWQHRKFTSWKYDRTGEQAATGVDIQIIPYVIPGRTGTQLYPQDLAILSHQYQNVNAVKEGENGEDGNVYKAYVLEKNSNGLWEVKGWENTKEFIIIDQ